MTSVTTLLSDPVAAAIAAAAVAVGVAVTAAKAIAPKPKAIPVRADDRRRRLPRDR